MVRSPHRLALVIVLAGCGRFEFSSIPDAAAPIAECSAQRAIHIVAGNGGLAWFTLVWPLPAVITGFQSSYAYDDPAAARLVVTGADHPLYARRGLWADAGGLAMPSAFVAGRNETHTNLPISNLAIRGSFVLPAGVAAQQGLGAPLPVLGFGIGAPYFSPTIQVADIDGAIAALRAITPISPKLEHALRPDPATLQTWYSATASPQLVALAQRLLFAANAFRAGLVGTVLLRGFNDDPHGAFDMGIATAGADDLVGVLLGVQRELAAAQEPTCGHLGAPLALADNVVWIIAGDTPKDSFANAGWPDGTANGLNWLYVRGNGYLRPGWFGEITATTTTRFNPASGLLDPTATDAQDVAGADLAILYAISRGDAGEVATFAPDSYGGLVTTSP